MIFSLSHKTLIKSELVLPSGLQGLENDLSSSRGWLWSVEERLRALMDSLVLNWIALFSILSHFCPQAASGSIWWKHNILVFGSSLLFPPNTSTAQIIRWIHDGDRFIKFWSLAHKEAGTSKEAHYSSCSVGNEALNNRQKCLEVSSNLKVRTGSQSRRRKTGKCLNFVKTEIHKKFISL